MLNVHSPDSTLIQGVRLDHSRCESSRASQIFMNHQIHNELPTDLHVKQLEIVTFTPGL